MAIFIQFFSVCLPEERAFTSRNVSCLKTRAQSKSCCLDCLCAQRREAGSSRWQFSPAVLKWDELPSGVFVFRRWLFPIDQALTLRSPKTGEVSPTPALRYRQAEATPRDWLRQQLYSRGSLSSGKIFALNQGVRFLGKCWVRDIKVMDTQKYLQVAVEWPFRGAVCVPKQ